jgi:hypothetical protein
LKHYGRPLGKLDQSVELTEHRRRTADHAMQDTFIEHVPEHRGPLAVQDRLPLNPGLD